MAILGQDPQDVKSLRTTNVYKGRILNISVVKFPMQMKKTRKTFSNTWNIK
jgi:hypothetical protein